MVECKLFGLVRQQVRGHPYLSDVSLADGSLNLCHILPSCGGSDLSHLAAFSTSVGSIRGRIIRNPTCMASVKCQMLCGSQGSCCFQARVEPTRAALRRSA